MPSHPEAAQRTEAIFRSVGALLENDHFVNINGQHSSGWIDKDALNPHPALVDELCEMLWNVAAPLEPEVICGPAIGGLIVAMEIAHLAGLEAVFTEHKPAQGEELRGRFIFRRGYDVLVKGKKVLVVDDIVNGGQSVRQTSEAIRAAGGTVCGIACYVDRGNLAADEFAGVPYRYLLQWKLPSWPEADTPPEVLARPVNTQHGHGAEYLAQHGADQN